MSKRTLTFALLAVVTTFLASGCGLFAKQSRRTITTTHWGGTEGAAMAQSQPAAPAPKVEQPPADQSGETKSKEGAEKMDESADAGTKAGADAAADKPQTASNANVGASSAPTGNGQNLTLYVAYSETISTQNMLNGDTAVVNRQSHVRTCKLKDDSSLECTESPELNKMLNPHLHQK